MGKSRLSHAVLALVLIAQVGCGIIQKPGWRKPWGRGAVIPAAICTVIGAGTGAYIQHLRPGYSCIDSDPTREGCEQRVEDNPEYWKGALVGGAIGAVLCGVLGHVFIDEEEVVTALPVPSGAGDAPSGAGIVINKKIILRGVNFDFDKSEIRPDSRPILNEAATILGERRAEIEMLVVEGHTDGVGTDEYNEGLSVRRAESVYRYLVNAGVAPEIMRSEGFGESRPVSDNETDSGRAMNRRVELQVVPLRAGATPTPEPTTEPVEVE